MLRESGLENSLDWMGHFQQSWVTRSESHQFTELKREHVFDFSSELSTVGRFPKVTGWCELAQYLRPLAKPGSRTTWTWSGHGGPGLLVVGAGPSVRGSLSYSGGLSLQESDVRAALMKVRSHSATDEEYALVECLLMTRESLKNGGTLELAACKMGFNQMGDRMGKLLATLLPGVRIVMYTTNVKWVYTLQVTEDSQLLEVVVFRRTE